MKNNKKIKFSIIIQARMNSKRLPGKVLKEYRGLSPLGVLIDRLIEKKFDKKEIIITTTTKKIDKKIINFSEQNKLNFFTGDENDVLGRFYKTAVKFKVQNIIRITSDCPFVDLNILKKMITIFKTQKYDYLANTYPLPCTFPDGMDIEIFKFSTLKMTHLMTNLPSDREHVTKFMWGSGKFKCKKINLKRNLSSYRITIDTKKDYQLFKMIINTFNYKKLKKIGMFEIIEFIKKYKNKLKGQQRIKRNSGWISSLKKDLEFIKKKV